MGGLEGAFASDKWHYEGFYAFGQTKEAQTSGGQVNVLNFRNALEAIPDADDVDGDGNTTEAICRDANARAQGCVPVNVFGFNSMSPEAIKYIQAPGSLATFTSQRVLGASLTGEVFDMPAGPFAIAVGAEYREEFSSSEFDPLTQAGLNAGNAIPPTEGEFDVSEAYLEVNVPILKELPFADSLSFRGAIRASDYSTVGNTLSWNAGLRVGADSLVAVPRDSRSVDPRAEHQRVVLAAEPDVPDWYSGSVRRCYCNVERPYVRGLPRGAGCDCEHHRQRRSFTLNQADIQGICGFDRGNPDLTEEEGNSWTIGAVIQPEDIAVLDKFDFTVDYYKIDISDAIVQTDRNFILNQCYGGGNQSFCNFVTRRPTAVGANSAGSIEFLDAGVTNSGGEFAEGVDLTVGFNTPIGSGKFNARLSYTHLLDHYQIPLPDEDKDQLSGEVGDSDDKAYLIAGLQHRQVRRHVADHLHLVRGSRRSASSLAYDLEPGSVGIPLRRPISTCSSRGRRAMRTRSSWV